MINLKLNEQEGIVSVIALGAILLLAVSLPVATRLVQKSQENRSSAASNITQDSKCKNAGGVCKSTSANCNGSWKSGYCPSSGSNVKCCVPKSGSNAITQDSKCKNAGGVCQKTSTDCSGSWKSGYCPSNAANVKCCVPKSFVDSVDGENVEQ